MDGVSGILYREGSFLKASCDQKKLLFEIYRVQVSAKRKTVFQTALQKQWDKCGKNYQNNN